MVITVQVLNVIKICAYYTVFQILMSVPMIMVAVNTFATIIMEITVVPVMMDTV